MLYPTELQARRAFSGCPSDSTVLCADPWVIRHAVGGRPAAILRGAMPSPTLAAVGHAAFRRWRFVGRYSCSHGSACAPDGISLSGTDTSLREIRREESHDTAMRLTGKVALISGAARGMGACEARLFARE